MKAGTLVAVTTFNNSTYTRRCLESLAGQPCDVIVVDDCSTDNTREICRQMRVEFIGRAFPRGLTYSYNLSYRRFLAGDHQFLILANNDIIVPQGAVASLANCLARHPFVGAMTRRGDKTVFANQAVEGHYAIAPRVTGDPANAQFVQDLVHGAPFQAVWAPQIYGFCFGCGQPLSMVETYNASPKARTGEVLGLRMSANRLSQFAAPLFFGVVGSSLGVLSIFLISGAFLLGGGYLVRPRKT